MSRISLLLSTSALAILLCANHTFAAPQGGKQVEVTNPVLPVTGKVDVSGTVAVNNLPEVQQVEVINPTSASVLTADALMYDAYFIDDGHSVVFNLDGFTHITSIALINPLFGDPSDFSFISIRSDTTPYPVHNIFMNQAAAANAGANFMQTFTVPIPADRITVTCQQVGALGDLCRSTIAVTGINLEN